jgi:hypothetical protein
MKVHPFYTLLVVGAVAWLWNNNIQVPTVNPAEAIGFDLVAIGLPLGLLWWSARLLRRDLIEKGSRSPNKVVFGLICSAGALMSIIDIFTLSNPHHRGAIMLLILFAISATILFLLARRDQAAIPSEEGYEEG